MIESITYLITHHNQYQTTLEDTQKQPNNSIASATNNNIQQPIERNMVNSSSTSKSILTRQDALQQIQAVKEYFVAHEPHSPIRLLLNRCLKWSRMSFSQLIQEIVSDEKEIESIFKITGIEKHKEKTCQV